MDLRRLAGVFYAVQFDEDPNAVVDRLCRDETLEEFLGSTRVELLDLLTAALSSHETLGRFDTSTFHRSEESIRGFLQALHDRLAAMMIEALRRSWANGARPSELLRSLLAEGVTGARMITMMQHAFSLPLSKTGAIPAWATDGDDDRLDRILTRLMPARDQHPLQVAMKPT